MPSRLLLSVRTESASASCCRADLDEGQPDGDEPGLVPTRSAVARPIPLLGDVTSTGRSLSGLQDELDGGRGMPWPAGTMSHLGVICPAAGKQPSLTFFGFQTGGSMVVTSATSCGVTEPRSSAARMASSSDS